MAKSKLVNANKKIAEKVVGGYKKIEKGVVGGYKKIEKGVVGGYKKIEDAFVDRYLTHEGETVADAQKRLHEEQENRKAKNKHAGIMDNNFQLTIQQHTSNKL